MRAERFGQLDMRHQTVVEECPGALVCFVNDLVADHQVAGRDFMLRRG